MVCACTLHDLNGCGLLPQRLLCSPAARDAPRSQACRCTARLPRLPPCPACPLAPLRPLQARALREIRARDPSFEMVGFLRNLKHDVRTLIKVRAPAAWSSPAWPWGGGLCARL